MDVFFSPLVKGNSHLGLVIFYWEFKYIVPRGGINTSREERILARHARGSALLTLHSGRARTSGLRGADPYKA